MDRNTIRDAVEATNEQAGNQALGRLVGEGMTMARITGANPSKQGVFQGMFTRLVYAMTKRKVGRVVMPAKIAAHHSRLLWGYGQMEQSLLGSHLVEERLKNLGELRVATMVGCPF